VSEWTKERIDLVKRTICPRGITDDEFALFIEQCKRSGLDPLLKEAFCVPRKQNVGTRDMPKWIERHEFQPAETGMLARAERFPDYRGTTAAAAYEADALEIDAGAGLVSHKFSPGKKRGALIGAWAKVDREGKASVVIWLDLEGYKQTSPNWSKIPATMMEKCARVAALRKAYPSAFGGLYVQEEQRAAEAIEAGPELPALPANGVGQTPEPPPPPKNGKKSTRTEQLKKQLQVVDVQPGESEQQATERTNGNGRDPALSKRGARLWSAAQGAGWDVVRFQTWCHRVIGVSKSAKEMTADDLLALENMWIEEQEPPHATNGGAP
jgi:phage recombination protein Bet